MVKNLTYQQNQQLPLISNQETTTTHANDNWISNDNTVLNEQL